MQCHQCDHDNPAHATFCLEYGTALGAPCPHCGTNLPGGAKFCLTCGAAVRGSSSGGAHTPSGRPPDRDPRQHTPERAVRAALDMQRALAGYADELRAPHGIDFRVRIGVHTGPVVVGSVGGAGHADYTALGDTTNLAARLQTAAAPGTVLISEQTAKEVARRFAPRAVGPLKLKCKSQPVTAFEVVRTLPRTPLLPGSSRGLTPLVGRAAELATLQTLFGHAGNGRS